METASANATGDSTILRSPRTAPIVQKPLIDGLQTDPPFRGEKEFAPCSAPCSNPRYTALLSAAAAASESGAAVDRAAPFTTRRSSFSSELTWRRSSAIEARLMLS